MKKSIPIKITSFKLEKRKDKISGKLKTENIPILIDFKFDGQRVIFPIGYSINSSKWNAEQQQVRRNNFNKDGTSAKTINDRINFIEEQLPLIYYEAERLNIPITKDNILNELKSRIRIKEQRVDESTEEKAYLNVSDYIELFAETESKVKNWSSGTIKRMKVLKNHLLKYNPKLIFEDINEDFLQKYIEYQTKVLNLNNSTNQKYIKIFKWFLNWATKKGYNTNLAYKAFEYKFRGVTISDYQQNVIFFTWDELMHLYNFDFSNNKKLEQVRDIYCFCCFTSLRYSDVENLKKHDIKSDNNGNYYIELLTIKTDDKLTIELNKYAISIYEKYKDTELRNFKAFPVISNQKYNSYLKEMAKIAGFNKKESFCEYKGNKRIESTFEKWELITSHTARKTFIITALYLNISPDIIRSWTGHKDYRTMELYVKIVNEQKRISMNKFNEI